MHLKSTTLSGAAISSFQASGRGRGRGRGGARNIGTGAKPAGTTGRKRKGGSSNDASSTKSDSKK